MSRLLHERFFAAAERAPEAVAIVDGERDLRYGELAERVRALAGALAAELEPGEALGILLPKGADAIVFMLAALAAGRPYVPIDRSAPPERQALIARLGGIAALVAGRSDHAEWGGRDDLPALRRLLAPDEKLGAGGCPPAPNGDRTAYVLFTSGSTGVPKGVVITHANAAHFAAWAVRRFELSGEDRLAVHAPLHFDLPVLDVYAGLAAGATVCPIDERTALFPGAVRQFLVERRISVMYAVPSAWTALVARGGLRRGELPLRLALYAGEEFHVSGLRDLRKLLDAHVFNLYGPVETNVVTAHEVTPADLREADHVPIGTAIPGVQVHLRGEDGSVLSAPGGCGEICVAGPTVSPGYLTEAGLETPRVELQAPGGRLSCYPTGDYARWDEGGELVFAGRRDGLVKVRGFRIEIGDVEAALSRHEDVSESVVYTVGDEPQARTLHAVVVPCAGRTVDEDALVDWCRSVLPPYMVPSRIGVESELEHTSTGKIDRRALCGRLEAVGG